MDNMGFHKTKEVKDMLRGAKLSFLLTAPWSRELNLIEYIFFHLEVQSQGPT